MNFSDSAAPPTKQRHGDTVVFQIAAGDYHLVRAFHQQPGKANCVRMMLAERLDQIFRWNLDSEIDYL